MTTARKWPELRVQQLMDVRCHTPGGISLSALTASFGVISQPLAPQNG